MIIKGTEIKNTTNHLLPRQPLLQKTKREATTSKVDRDLFLFIAWKIRKKYHLVNSV